MANQERDPRPYELMSVFIPDLSEEDNQAQIEKVSSYITNAGGSITETLTSSPWGRRRLAYTIRFNGVDYRDGFYTVYHFDAAPSLLTEIERDLKLDTSVMRYLLVHDDPKAGEQFSEEAGAEGEAAEGTSAQTPSTEQAAGTATATAAPAQTESTETAEEPATEEASAAPAEETAAEPAPASAAEATEGPAPEPAAAEEAPTSEAPSEEAQSEDSDTTAEAEPTEKE